MKNKKKIDREFLSKKTVAPELSELFNRTHELLELVSDGARNFMVLLYHEDSEDDEDMSGARIIPITDEYVKEFLEYTEEKLKYTVTTDKDFNIKDVEQHYGQRS